MKANENTTDRIVRAVIGIALLLLAFLVVTNVALKVILIVVGAVALFTAITGFCLLYRAFNFSTKH